MYPENEEQLVDSAREHIESASIADGLEDVKKEAPAQGEGDYEFCPPDTTMEPDIVAAAAEHIEDAAVADGLADR